MVQSTHEIVVINQTLSDVTLVVEHGEGLLQERSIARLSYSRNGVAKDCRVYQRYFRVEGVTFFVVIIFTTRENLTVVKVLVMEAVGLPFLCMTFEDRIVLFGQPDNLSTLFWLAIHFYVVVVA